MASGGGWSSRVEAALDDPARGSRSADVLLERTNAKARMEIALMEIWDWFDDVGAGFRSWDGKVARVERGALARIPLSPADAREEAALPHVGGCWIVRATVRNRALVAAHRALFAARFPGAGREWLRAITDPNVAMPAEPAMLWVSVTGDRIWPVRTEHLG